MRQIATFFKVLAHEDRLRMVWLLFQRRELCVCDITEVLGITQSKASRHLRILLGAGVVVDRRDGLWVHYALRTDAEPRLAAHLELLRSTLAGQPEAVALVLALAEHRGAPSAAGRCAAIPEETHDR